MNYLVEMEQPVQLDKGKTYRLTFIPIPQRNNVIEVPPMKVTVLELSNTHVKAESDGEMVSIPIEYILRAELVHTGGRKRRRVTRKGTRKSRRSCRK
jgi:hypothetical protein